MFNSRKMLAALFAVALLVGSVSTTAEAGYWNDRCCKPDPCCFKPAPPPMCKQTLCLKDPCSCCTTSVDVCIPACCCDEEPCISYRKGLFGRRIYNVTWKCCGHCVTIVWTKHGKVRVHD